MVTNVSCIWQGWWPLSFHSLSGQLGLMDQTMFSGISLHQFWSVFFLFSSYCFGQFLLLYYGVILKVLLLWLRQNHQKPLDQWDAVEVSVQLYQETTKNVCPINVCWFYQLKWFLFLMDLTMAKLIKLDKMAGAMHEADHAYSIRSTWWLYRLATDVSLIACVINLPCTFAHYLELSNFYFYFMIWIVVL